MCSSDCCQIIPKQHPRLNSEPRPDPTNVVDRDVALGPLDGAEISPVDPALMGERLLAEATLGAKPTHVLRQNVSQGALCASASRTQFLRIVGFKATAFKSYSLATNRMLAAPLKFESRSRLLTTI